MKNDEKSRQALLAEIEALKARLRCLESQLGETSIPGGAAAETQLFRIVAEAAPVGIFMVQGTRFVYVNSSFAGLVGLEPADAIGREYWEMVHPEDRAMVRERGEARQRGASVPDSYMLRILNAAGETRWVNFHGTAIRYQGEPGILGFVHDITGHRETDKLLKASEEKYRTLVESAGEAISSVDQNGIFLFMNREAARQLGGHPDEFIGKSQWEIFPKWLADRQMESIRQVFETGQGFAQEVVTVMQGKERTHQTTGIPVRNIDGKITSVLGIARDVTELNEVRTRLLESEDKYKNFIDNLPIGVFQSTPDGKVLSGNPSLARLYGYDSVEEYLAIPAEQTWADPKQRREWVQLLEQKGSVSDYEVKLRRKDGTYIWVSVSAQGSFDGHNKLVRIDGVEIDVTARRKAEEALRRTGESMGALLNAPRNVMFMMDAKGTLLALNEAAAKETGLSVDAALGTCVYDYMPQELARARARCGEEVFRTGRLVQFEENLGDRLLENTVYPVFGDNRQVEAVVVSSIDISEARRALDALRDSEEKYRNLFENAQAGIFRSTLDGSRVLAVNKRAADILGYSVEEYLVAPAYLAWYDPSDRSEMKRILQEQGFVRDFEFKARTKSGECRNLLISAQLYREGGFLEGSVIDITERLENERALRESEELFRAVADTAPVVIVINQGEKLIYANRAALTAIGMDASELGKVNFSDFIHPSHRQMVTNIALARQRGEAVPTTYEAKVVTRSGEIRWALFSGSRIEYEGKPAALGIAVDITERKLAEETLRKLTHRLSVASESANIGIWDLDLEKNHLVWDDRMYQMYGVSASDFGGALETWQGSLHPDDLDRASREVSEAISGTGDFHTSFRIVVPDGQVRYIEAHASVLNTPEGKPDRMVGVNLDITERKLAEEALRNSESLSRAVVYNSPVGISIRSAKGELLSVNDAWMKIWNLSPEEVEHFINEGPNDLAGVHKLRILGQWVPQIESVYRKGGVLRIPEVHYSDDSSARPRWVSFTYYSVMNDQGEVDRVIILTEDITERKLTDKALKERHKELNCLYSIYALSEEEDFSLYEILKKTITLIPPAWQFPEVTEAYVALDGLTVQTERFRETSWILASEIVVRDKPAGEVKVCYLEDWKADNEGPFLAEEKHLIKAIAERLGFIVESKLLKKELQESEEKFRRITERSFDAIYHVDVDGMLTYVSPAAERLAGYRPDDVIGRHVSEFITEKYLPSVGKALAITATGKVVEGLQFEIIAADAHLVFVEANATPIIHNDRVVATQALVRDISARRHAEQMLEKALEEQSRQLRQVAGGLAHDIYNDLYPVSASIHKLRQRFEHPEDPNPERNLKLLQLMEGAVLRAIDLTEAVSLYSKLQRDTTSALTRIRKVIDQVLEHHKGRLDQLEVKTLVEVPDVLAVACSERNLHTLMTNLLLNSLDAVAGTQRPSLSIKARPTNGKVEITFGDNGSGIAPDILPRVFDPFFSTKPNTGTGLGLAIVKRVVDVCGGEIEVDSAVDIGTTFHILLPGDVGT